MQDKKILAEKLFNNDTVITKNTEIRLSEDDIHEKYIRSLSNKTIKILEGLLLEFEDFKYNDKYCSLENSEGDISVTICSTPVKLNNNYVSDTDIISAFEVNLKYKNIIIQYHSRLDYNFIHDGYYLSKDGFKEYEDQLIGFLYDIFTNLENRERDYTRIIILK